MNPLLNGDFELDWGVQSSHRALALVDGVPQERTIENIFTPAFWWTWFVHEPGTWDQPEVRDAWVQNDPARVHSGRKGTLLFTFYRQHDAGFLQMVSGVTPGQRLRLTAFAHAWSNHDEPWCTHADDPTWSTGIGRGGVAAIEGAFPLTGKPLDDAKSNFIFAVGIDPTGGTNPLADTVVWGQAWHIYNAYYPVTVEAVAQATTVTVFLRSRTLWGFKHNDAYWDDASLEVVGDEPAPPGGGLPRIQYIRRVNVIPEDATLSRATEIFQDCWANGRQTVTGSYDDAGIGALADKTARLWDIPSSETSDYLDFFQEFYPGTKVEFVGGEPVPPTVDFLLSQRDPAWASEKIAGSACASTIGAMGCWITCCAMAQRYLGIDTQATPSTANKLLGPTGFSGCKTNWSAMARLGLEVVKREDSNLTVIDWVQAQMNTVAFVRVNLPGEHWLLVYDYDDVVGDFCVADPWRNTTGYLEELYPAGAWGDEPFRLVRKLQTAPPPPPPPPPVQPRNYLGLHLQTMVGGWDGYVRDTGTTTKVLASMQDVIGVKRVRPDVPVFWRHVTNNYGDTLENPDPLAGARKWVAKFSDSLRIECDRLAALNITAPYFYVESVNEVYPPTPRAVAFDRAFIVALAELGLPVAPCVMTAAVGNPHESEFPLLIPLARECAAAGGAFGYHAYWMANGEDPDALTKYWQWLAGRWTEMDKVLVAAGVRVKWAFTECGAVGGKVGAGGGFALYPSDGWLSNTCYNGDWARYLADMRKFNELTAASVAGREGRVIGGHVFTSGQGVGWEKFQIRDPQMQGMRTL